MSVMNKLFDVSGKVALITGGSSGLGEMMAEALAFAGAKVMIASRKGDICESVAKNINAKNPRGQVIGFAGDVSSEASITQLRDAVTARTDRLDILINNAGISWGAPIESFPHAQWERVMGVNVAGMFTLTRELLPLLRKSASADNPARIVNIGSIMGTAPAAEGAYSYSMSKAAVHHLTKILSGELAPDHITVNAIAPGPFPSKMTAFATGTESGASKVASNVPLGRIGTQQDIAGAILFLCARAGAYMSGAILPLDGGMSAANPVDLFANTLTPD